MLLEFRVKNYKSIKEEQVLSMAGSSSLSSSEKNRVKTGINAAPEVLTSAMILGPNASGKSNLIEAIEDFSDFATRSVMAIGEGEGISVVPFLMDDETIEQPSEFEISFIIDGSIYRYGLSLNQKMVLEEWLYYRSRKKGSREIEVFSRKWDDDVNQYNWNYHSTFLKGPKKEWEKSTRMNASFLSTAVQLNSSELKIPLHWLSINLKVIGVVSSALSKVTSVIIYENDGDDKEQVLNFIQGVDLSISDIQVEQEEVSKEIFPHDMPEDIKDVVLKTMKEANPYVYNATTIHENNKRKVAFELWQESKGTNKIYELAGPWIMALRFGFTVVVDELSNHLHPAALKYLVDKFNDPELNKKGAQLIFTSHSVNILESDCLERDQVWIMERSDDQSTHLTPLTDFNPRNNEAIAKGYLAGKYGGIPLIKGFFG